MWLPFSMDPQLMLLEFPVLCSHSPVPAPEGRYIDLPLQEQSIGHSSSQNIFLVQILYTFLLLNVSLVNLHNGMAKKLTQVLES